MLAPVISGQLFYFIGYMWTGVFIAGWNILSVICEYTLLSGIYTQYPRLAQKITSSKIINNKIEEQLNTEETCQLTNEHIEKQSTRKDPKTDKNRAIALEKIIPKNFRESFGGWQMYFDHPVRYNISLFGI
jgi:hypothetical protein